MIRDEAFVFASLANLHRMEPIARLAHGGATGADTLAGAWAAIAGVECVVYKADWKAHGRAAGPIRNAKMLADENPDMVVAFPGGAGTASCVLLAQRAGLVVADLRRSYVSVTDL
jgi:hypothetical protein